MWYNWKKLQRKGGVFVYYHALNEYLRQRFGCKVYKLALSSGCSCPNRDGTIGDRGCIFCDGAGAFAEIGDIATQIQQAKTRLQNKAGGGKYIAYFQSFSNTYSSVSRLEPLFTAALEPPEVAALSVATRPDCLPTEILDLLERLNRKKPVWVELGLQTIYSTTTVYIRRGFDLACFDRAMAELNARGLETVVHLILGLPGENRAQMIETARYVGASGAKGVKFHLLHVLRDTDLAADWSAGRVETLEMEKYISILEDCLRVLPREVVIHRLTGDGAKRDLLAPLWSADKKRVLNAVRAAFARDDLEQGERL